MDATRCGAASAAGRAQPTPQARAAAEELELETHHARPCTADSALLQLRVTLDTPRTSRQARAMGAQATLQVITHRRRGVEVGEFPAADLHLTAGCGRRAPAGLDLDETP